MSTKEEEDWKEQLSSKTGGAIKEGSCSCPETSPQGFPEVSDRNAFPHCFKADLGKYVSLGL